ncbi:fructose-bisphosphate aldolase class I [Oscillatoria sp. FACHB-1407]|uniref:class I fructose-bisphosphate aldolase n=1 Tax=Oscillatoria sp. FACHB-1407 TaxID=2692847 RepID=UPI00168375FB|nr:class I fructose-bisphosphate aldolase [Oscillatoria sp. FACHB-1407]MBD2461824.1 fructose-bisphosphate aldolase class I [Oscillatoria sp. FACHB-1407]
MYTEELKATAKAMVAPGKGILAADESYGTANKRFQKLGIPTTEEMRRAYREMLFTASGIGNFFSGVILFDETIRQSTKDGVPFTKVLMDAGIIPGIKLDAGAKPLAKSPNEVVTEGLDGLRDRIKEYYDMGARFAKWRAVITIGDGIPSRRCIEVNAHALARYAALCQEGGLVPIVEPEVLMDGDHTLERSYEVHQETLKTVFYELHRQGIDLDQMILKPSMVIPGENSPNQVSAEEVARATVKCLLDCVPASVPGCAFLSGGQSDEDATAHLNAMNQLFKGQLPWHLTFSYGRALQQAAMQTWGGRDENVAAAQKALYHRAKCNSAAALGEYSRDMEAIAV